MNSTAKPLSEYAQSLLGGVSSVWVRCARVYGVVVFVIIAFATRSVFGEAVWAGPEVKAPEVKSPEAVVAHYLRAAIATTSKSHDSSEQANSQYYVAYRAMAPSILQTHNFQLSREMALGGGKEGGGRTGLLSQFSEAQAERLEDAYIRLMIGKRVRLMMTQGWLRFEQAARHRLKGGRVMIWVSLYLRDGAKQSIGFILQRQSATSGAVWRIINTQLGHFSELAEQRVRYQRLVQTGGPEALLSDLERRLEK